MTKFKNKYRVESNRLKSWDYGSNALYFITICCKNRKCFFGTVSDEKIILSKNGKIVEKYWLEIPKHFPFVVLHNHIVMPNHMHGIIEIAHNAQMPKLGVSSLSEEPKLGISTSSKTQNASQIWKPGILGLIINQYKRICTINARKKNPDFAWQPNYHDHVIRNQKAYQNIFNYITNNPKKWTKDTFNNK